MNIAELANKLEELKINPHAYNLGEDENEAYCLEKSGIVWEVYYSERGNKSNLKQFDSEDDACVHFLDLLSSDESTRL